MKKIAVLFLVPCLLFVSEMNAQINSIDTLVNRAFISIKNVDEQAYIKLFPTFPQLKNFFDGLVNSVSDSSQKAAMKYAFSQINEEKYNSEIRPKVIASFQEFISNGRKMGIDWTRVRLDSFTTSEEKAEGFADIKAMNGNIYFTDHDSSYVVPFSDVLWIKEEQGWFGFEMKRILKKGEEIADDETITGDITVSDTAMVEVPPDAGVKKPVSKKPVSKKPTASKPQTKQPAKKPGTTTKTKT